MKILIAGDSFAADWKIKYRGNGWVNMLFNDYDVTNIAQAGVSEYKIYQQLINHDTTKYDEIIISHTSAYRIPVVEHPIHSKDILHSNCDLIYTDIKEHENNPKIKPIIDFYENYFHIDSAIFTHTLIVNEIKKLHPNAINITFFDSFNQDMYQFENVFLNNGGNMNHMNEVGNRIIYNEIKTILNGDNTRIW
jgi:hypothetical protein